MPAVFKTWPILPKTFTVYAKLVGSCLQQHCVRTLPHLHVWEANDFLQFLDEDKVFVCKLCCFDLLLGGDCLFQRQSGLISRRHQVISSKWKGVLMSRIHKHFILGKDIFTDYQPMIGGKRRQQTFSAQWAISYLSHFLENKTYMNGRYKSS